MSRLVEVGSRKAVIKCLILCLIFILMAVWVVFSAQAQTRHTGSRLQLTQRRHDLHKCVWPEYYSISYRDPRTQKLGGLDIELARILAAELGVKLRFVDSSFSRWIPDLVKESCDVAMFAVGITPERAEQIDFTEHHLVSDMIAITTKNNRSIQQWDDLDQPGHVLAVAKVTWNEAVMRERLQYAEVVAPDTAETRETEVLSG